MDMPRFSIILWTKDTNELFFKDCIESLVSQTYEFWDLYVLDNNASSACQRIVSEFFPEDDRVHFRKMKNSDRLAYALNIGFHFVFVDAARLSEAQRQLSYVVCMNQHDRLQPNTLSVLAEQIRMEEKRPDFIYTDHDEIVGMDRMNPHFKSGFNKELLRRCPYMGDFIVISQEAARVLGEFEERLRYASMYEFILRGMERNMSFLHIPALLYHKRILVSEDKKAEAREKEKSLKEHMLVAETSLRREGLVGEVTKAPANTEVTYWNVTYAGDDALSHQKEYKFLRDKDVRAFSRHNLEKMYGVLRQKDVAIVGARFVKSGFAYENCGYIYDTNGFVFPAFYDQKIYRPTYEQLGSIPRDVSMVDFGYCMIDAKVYRKLQGFDADLTGRDLMLDFCMRAKAAGFRTVVLPDVVVRRNEKQIDSSESSHILLQEKWQEQFVKGDPLYNRNLPATLENYPV